VVVVERVGDGAFQAQGAHEECGELSPGDAPIGAVAGDVTSPGDAHFGEGDDVGFVDGPVVVHEGRRVGPGRVHEDLHHVRRPRLPHHPHSHRVVVGVEDVAPTAGRAHEGAVDAVDAAVAADVLAETAPPLGPSLEIVAVEDATGF